MQGHFSGCNWEKCSCELKRYWLIFVIALVIFVVEVIGGILSGSLALLSDAGHVLADQIIILTAIAIESLIYAKPHRHKTLRPIGAYINVVILFAIAGWIFFGIYQRIGGETEIATITMLVVATLGAAGNYLQIYILRRSRGDNLTRQAIFTDLSTDFLQSVGVVVGGLLILLTGRTFIDPLISFIIALRLFISAFQLAVRARKEQTLK